MLALKRLEVLVLVPEVVCRNLVGGQELALEEKLTLKRLGGLTRLEQKVTLKQRLTGRIFVIHGSLRRLRLS